MPRRKKTAKRIIEEQLGIAGIDMLKRVGLTAMPTELLEKHLEIFRQDQEPPLADNPVMQGIYATAIAAALEGKKVSVADGDVLTETMAEELASFAVAAIVMLSTND